MQSRNDSLNHIKDFCAVTFYGASPTNRKSMNSKMGRVAILLHGTKTGLAQGLIPFEEEYLGRKLDGPDLVMLLANLKTFVKWYRKNYGQGELSSPDTILDYWGRYREWQERIDRIKAENQWAAGHTSEPLMIVAPNNWK